jgi:hypothetical protein
MTHPSQCVTHPFAFAGYGRVMRSVDLATWADSLAGQAVRIAARIERGRAEIRQAAVESEARAVLPGPVVARLDSMGVLAQPGTGIELAQAQVVELLEDLRAVELLQAWVEQRLGAPRRPFEGGEASTGRPSEGPYQEAA